MSQSPDIDHGSDPRSQPLGPEGLRLGMLDRPIGAINCLYEAAFGFDISPVMISIYFARGLGRLTIGDFGCGTGRGLVTWKKAVAQYAPCPPDQIQAIGLSLHDYSTFSDYQEIREAPHNGTIDYKIGDIADSQTLEEVENDSIDVALSHNGMSTVDDPKLWLEHIVRLLAPGGLVYFNLSLAHIQQRTRVAQYIYELLGYHGYRGAAQLIKTETADGIESYGIFHWLQKPRPSK